MDDGNAEPLRKVFCQYETAMTRYELSVEDRQRLRSLAKRQAEIAALPIMEGRQKMWTQMNDAVPGARPPFAIETWTFDRDFMPSSIFHCASEYGRSIEGRLLRNIRQFEIIGDDHVCPSTFDIGWHVWCDEFGIEIPTHYEKDSDGIVTGYHFDCPITDLSDGFDIVRPSTFGVDREGTIQEKEFLQDLFGDILPINIKSGTYGATCLTQRLVRLMSMETFFLAMYDCPEILHQLMAYLRDNAMSMCRWAEAEGLLVLNNGNQSTCGTCFNFTTLLPKQPCEGQVRLADMWGVMDSQETVGISPDLFHEFCYPYYADLASLFGLVYWGCCEPADPLWEKSLRHLPNLKAISISRWANEEYMTQALAGTGIVYSRKPNPNLLGVDRELNEEAWTAELRKTLELTTKHAVSSEFIVRDVYTLHGNLHKAKRATELAKQVIDEYYPAID